MKKETKRRILSFVRWIGYYIILVEVLKVNTLWWACGCFVLETIDLFFGDQIEAINNKSIEELKTIIRNVKSIFTK